MNLTFELSRLDNGIDSFNSLGFSSLIFNRLEANARVATDGDTNAYSGNLGLNGSNWRFTADSRYFEAGFRNTSDRELFEHRLDFDVYPTDRLVVSLIGKDVQREDDTFNFLLPGVSLYGEHYSVSSQPFNDEMYKTTVTWNKDAIYARYDYFDAESFLSFDYRLNPEFNVFANARFSKKDSDLYELGFDWFPDTIDDTRSNIRASVLSSSDSELGYSLGLERNLLPGIFARLELEKQPSNGLDDNDTRLFLQLGAEFSYTGNRLVPADLRESRLSHGSLAGKIITNDIDINQFGPVNLVSIQINGVRRVVPLRGNTFFVDDIETGIHRIRLDSKTFPIEFSTDQSQTYWVKISPSAVSYVNFVIDIKLGFAGRVATDTDTYLANIKLVVKNTKHEIVFSTTTDQFGLYRVDALSPGSYTVHAIDENAKTLDSRTVILNDSYLFGQDLTIDHN